MSAQVTRDHTGFLYLTYRELHQEGMGPQMRSNTIHPHSCTMVLPPLGCMLCSCCKIATPLSTPSTATRISLEC